ncbi:MAG: OmpH family outer membrane protein [Pirellulales bacterium]|nr:OmpH family outer membrane protein [Pirellulales bacterium]
MTKSLLYAALAAIVLATGVVVWNASAQFPSQNPPAVASQVAVIDVDYIFQNHKRFKDTAKQVQESENALRKSFLEEEKAIRGMIRELQDLEMGTADFKQLEERITRRKNELQTQAELKKREFDIYKVRVLHGIHTEIRQEVASIAAARRITLVLKFGNSEPIDPQKPDNLVRDIGSMVMYSAPGVDITGEVLARLNQRAGYGNNATPVTHRNQTGGIPRG